MDAETEIIMTIAAAIVSILALSVVPVTPPAIQNGKTAPSVAGTWALAIKGPASHDDVSASLVLEQEGVKVTGSFSAHGSEHPVAGEFTDGTLTLETTGSEGNRHLTLTARLKSDGSLAGYLSGPMGDMQWTASRGAADGEARGVSREDTSRGSTRIPADRATRASASIGGQRAVVPARSAGVDGKPGHAQAGGERQAGLCVSRSPAHDTPACSSLQPACTTAGDPRPSASRVLPAGGAPVTAPRRQCGFGA
jgi:hypothetical protein